MVRFHLRRFEAWAISFTPLCPRLSEETLKAVGPNSCVSSRLGCLEYNYLRLEIFSLNVRYFVEQPLSGRHIQLCNASFSICGPVEHVGVDDTVYCCTAAVLMIQVSLVQIGECPRTVRRKKPTKPASKRYRFRS